MPHWPSKTVSTRLIKYISSVKISYNPFLPSPSDPKHSRGVREFESRLGAPRYKVSNPSLQITRDVHNRVWEGEGGNVKVTFVNGDVMELKGWKGKVGEIEDEVFRRAEDIEFDYEKQGKSVE
ncbi:hypothetical protein TrCOL_g10635 [Triparma columacea]|uniref:Uncharacterized protein n=1 Tax=Triparma columacea TaxID=722753 RepID=A0A9W7LCY8_9STRA|nr:hypothetical protein TrCOL_g10635 [Triparma columacea]